MALTTTGGRLYLIALKSLQKLEIQFVPPSLDFNRAPTIEEIAIVGRNNPLHHYIGGRTTLDFELDFHSDTADRTDVIKKCRWLEALGYNDGYQKPPEQIRLVFGKLFRDEIWIVKNVSYRLVQFDKPSGYMPIQAYVKLSLALDPKQNLRLIDVK